MGTNWICPNWIDEEKRQGEFRNVHIGNFPQYDAVHIRLLAEQLCFSIVRKNMRDNPDIEVEFHFNLTRRTPVLDGYRPAHLVMDGYLTTGIHHYYEVGSVPPGGTARGTITFLTPEFYPKCLWIGKTINIQEGERIVGYATVTQIFNPILNILEN